MTFYWKMAWRNLLRNRRRTIATASAIIAGYAAHFGLAYEEGDALEWSKRRGGRSGRVAWQYVNELAGRAGRAL